MQSQAHNSAGECFLALLRAAAVKPPIQPCHVILQVCQGLSWPVLCMQASDHSSAHESRTHFHCKTRLPFSWSFDLPATLP